MKKVFNIVEGLIKIMSSIFFILMILVVLLQVTVRFMPATVVVWTEEASRFFMVYMASFGSILAANATGGFIRVDIVTNLFPKKVGLVIEILGDLVVCWLLVMLVEPSLNLVSVRQAQMSPSLGIPMSIPQGAISIAIIGILTVFALNIIKKALSFKNITTSTAE